MITTNATASQPSTSAARFHHPSVECAYSRLAVERRGDRVVLQIGMKPLEYRVKDEETARRAAARLHASTFVTRTSAARVLAQYAPESASETTTDLSTSAVD